MRAPRRFRVGALGVLIVALALVGTASRLAGERPAGLSPRPFTTRASPVPAVYSLPPLSPTRMRNAAAVARALGFLKAMQPERTYVLSIQGHQVVVPMDVAHAAIALTSVDELPRAEAAMTWLYQRMIRPEDPDSIDQNGVDYAGSWYDDLRTDGSAFPGSARGRGESVGMALIATYAISLQDPRFLDRRIGDSRVIDLLKLATAFLTRPSMEAPDGRFYHSPSYRVSFNEECARMTLGLELASRLLRADGHPVAAAGAAAAARSGLRALNSGVGMDQGMAYDYYARSIWGLATPAQARQEVAWLRSTGLLSANGVRNWDWQLSTASSPLVWLRWWTQAQTIAPSQTFDFAIASVTAGDTATALDLERRWLPLQRADGGFDDAVLFGPFGLHVGYGDPTSYAVARFILLEHLLTVSVGI